MRATSSCADGTGFTDPCLQRRQKKLDRLSSAPSKSTRSPTRPGSAWLSPWLGRRVSPPGLFHKIFRAPSSWRQKPSSAIRLAPGRTRQWGRVRLLQKNRLREAQIELETALALDRN